MNYDHEKTPTSGQAGGASKTSTNAAGDDGNHSTSSGWAPSENRRVATDLTDFLMFHIAAFGVCGDLSRAVSFVKRESERLAYSQVGGHDE